MEERVGLYENSTKMSIVEECFSEQNKRKPFKSEKVSWAEIVKKGVVV